MTVGGCLRPEDQPDDVCAAEFSVEELEGEGVRTIGTYLPDDGEGRVHVRIAWPDAAPAGGALWPQALTLQGGWQQGMSEDGRVAASEGVVEVRVDLPGGGSSGGEEDRRGARSRAALARVLRWMAGEELDVGGCTAPRRTRWGDPSGLHLVGNSNGGNLAVATLADPSLDLPPVDGLVTWESPVSAELANVEIGADPTVYTPGSCTWEPDAGLTCALPEAALVLEPQLGEPGQLCFDLDQDGACTGGTDVVVSGTLDPDTQLRMLSPLLTRLATERGLDLSGYGDEATSTDWWAWRDASRRAGDLVTANPDLPVLIVASEEDHVQTAPDHPHVYGWGEALQSSGAAWTRLNPGAAWLHDVAGENAPDAPLSLDASEGRLLTEDEENPLGRVLAAAILELADLAAGGAG